MLSLEVFCGDSSFWSVFFLACSMCFESRNEFGVCCSALFLALEGQILISFEGVLAS